MWLSSLKTTSDATDPLQNAHQGDEGTAQAGLDAEEDPGTMSSGSLGFRFITVTKPDEHRDQKTRRYIRSHVMKEYHQRRHVAETRRPSSSQALLPRKLSPVSYLAARPGDPFSTLPLDLSETDRFFLHRYLQYAFDLDVTNRPFMKSTTIRNNYVPTAMKDPILLNAMLFAGARCLDSPAAYAGSSPNTLIYKGRVIKLLNQGLADQSRAISDSIIIGVLALMNFDCVKGNYNEYHMHAKALHRLVELRGGLERLGMNGFLEVSITNVDRTAAALFGTDPYHIPKIPQNSVVSISSLNSGFLPLPIFSNLSQELISILDDICAILSLANRMRGTVNWSSAEPCYRRLESLIAQRNSTAPLLEVPDIEESTATAALIFFVCICANIPATSWMASEVSRNVFEAINRLLAQDPHDEFLSLLLWLAFMGCLAAKSSESIREWSAMVAMIANEIGVSTWEQAMSILKTFLWLEPRSEVIGRRTWLQAQAFSII